MAAFLIFWKYKDLLWRSLKEVKMIQIIEGFIHIDNIEAFIKKIKKISKDKKVVIQALDADKLAGHEHIEFAVQKAVNSFETGKNIAGDLAKEILLYAAGTRQIKNAMKIGVHNGKNNIVIVAVGKPLDLLSEFSEIVPGDVLQYNKSKNAALKQIFNIMDEEIEAAGIDKIPELVLERVALADVMK